MRSFKDFLIRLIDKIDTTIPYEPAPGVRFSKIGRDTWRFHCGDYAADVATEMMAGKVRYSVDTDSPRHWLPPNDKAELTVSDRERIIGCMCKFFDHFGITYELI